MRAIAFGLSVVLACSGAADSSDGGVDATTPDAEAGMPTGDATSDVLIDAPADAATDAGIVRAHVIAGVTIFTPGTPPFNDIISGQSPTSGSAAIITGLAGVSNAAFAVSQGYVLHIQAHGVMLEPITSVSTHTIPNFPIDHWTQSFATGIAGDKAMEILETNTTDFGDGTNTLWDGFDFTAPVADGGTWTGYSGCKDDPAIAANVTYGPCNSTTGWHDVAIAGGLAPEELTGVWPQPGGGVNHALVIELPLAAYNVAGMKYGLRLRLHSSFADPSNAQASSVISALKTYGAIAAENGCCNTFCRVFEPQTGDVNYDPAVNTALQSIHISDFDVVP